MRYSESDLPRTEDEINAEERLRHENHDRLRRENEDLRRQLQELRASSHAASSGSGAVPSSFWHPSRVTIWALCLATVVVLVIAFFAGYLPMHQRTLLIADEARDREQRLPRVAVVTVGRSSRKTALQLPGNIQATTEAPLLARAAGYVKQRLVDIGDHVHAGQTLAIIEAPELDEQVRQAQAALQQAHAGVDQATANLQQGRSDLELARVTAKRWADLVGNGSVSVQESDQYQAQYKSKIAAVNALEQALVGQRSGVAVAEANLARLRNMQAYRVVVAPFTGVITVRNVDTGALVNSGSTLLFRIAQTATLRTYLNVPQMYASSVQRGDAASLTVSNLPGRKFTGSVARTANALDPASRTLLVEVHVPNPDGLLLPGMYAQVELSNTRPNPPLLIPSDALINSGLGTQVALVGPNHRVHLETIVAGRDYGDRIEVMSGLREGSVIVANPGDIMHEGAEIDPVPVSSTNAEH